MSAVRGGHGATPFTARHLAERLRELVAELRRHHADGHRLEAMIEQRGIAHGGRAGPGPPKPREKSGRVARELVPSTLRVEKDLAEGEVRFNAELILVGIQIRPQLAIRGVSLRAEVLGDELQLL